MSIPNQEKPISLQGEHSLEPPIIEAIVLPDGTVQSVHPLVLKGLAESVSNNAMPLHQAAEMGAGWFPSLPRDVIYRHLNDLNS
jgi:hypothetical protein